MKHRISLTVLMFSIAFIEGCSQVKPWERNHLANEAMQWGADPHKTMLENHIYFSKEASSGGNSAASGGCGCN